ncbi:TPA: hypothetical protein ACH3X1_010649 [Trebouxia sp. C0004]
MCGWDKNPMVRLYGTRKRLMPCSMGYHIAAQRSLGVFFLVQNLEVAYLLYRARYFFPVLIVVCATAAIVRLYLTLCKQHNKVMALMDECRLTPLVQGRAVASYRLVPGNVIVLQQGRAWCDIVILRGDHCMTDQLAALHALSASGRCQVFSMCMIDGNLLAEAMTDFGWANAQAFDGSTLCSLQMQAMHFQAMAWSLAASRVRPLAHMNRHKPSSTSCNFSTVVFVAVMAICVQAAQIGSVLFLTNRP